MMSSPLFQIKHSLTACLLDTSSYITAVARPQVWNRKVTWYVSFIHCHLGYVQELKQTFQTFMRTMYA